MHDVTIKQAKPGETLYDDQVKGLQLRAFENRKSFYIYFRTKLKVERRPKLGDYPTISLAKARELARETLVTVAEGKDPVVERDKQMQAPTMAGLWNKFKIDVADKKKSGGEDERQWLVYLAPKLGKKRVADIEFEDMQSLHHALADTPYQANRVISLASAMFNLAEKYKWRPNGSNPCRHISRYKEQRRKRIMQTPEAPAIAAALAKREDEYPQSVAFLYLLILSGPRKSEIAKVTWAQLEVQEREGVRSGILHLGDSKTGAKPVYIPPQGMRILDKLPRPKPTDKDQTLTGIKDPKKLWNSVREEARCPDLRMHDLRRSFISAGLACGYSLSQIGKTIGHANTQTTDGYAWLLADMQQEIAEASASRLESMMAG